MTGDGDVDAIRVYGHRVRQARRIRRYSPRAAAAAAGMTESRFSELEDARSSELPGETARRLSNALDFPVPFFSAEPAEPCHPGTLLFRNGAALTESETGYLAEHASAASEIFTALSDYASSPPLRLPELSDAPDPPAAARIVREQFGIGAHEPVGSLVRKAERAGILIIAWSFDAQVHDRLDAFSCWTGPGAGQPVIALRANSSWDRRRWSLAHEIGHAALHQRNRDGDIEAAANEFARELLLPSESLASEWPARQTITSLLPLKEKWGLSVQALAEHGFRAGLLDESRRAFLYRQLSSRRWPDGTPWKEREPGYGSREPEQPRMLGKMAEVGLGAGVSLDLLSRETGHWPVLFLQELLQVQMTAGSGRKTRQAPQAAEAAQSRVVSMADWLRKADGKSHGKAARATRRQP